MATATAPAPVSKSPVAAFSVEVRPGVPFRLATGHKCSTFNVVFGVCAYECAHHHVLRPEHVLAAFLRAGEPR